MPTNGSRMITPMIAPMTPPKSNASVSPMPSQTVKIRYPSRAPARPSRRENSQDWAAQPVPHVGHEHSPDGPGDETEQDCAITGISFQALRASVLSAASASRGGPHSLARSYAKGGNASGRAVARPMASRAGGGAWRGGRGTRAVRRRAAAGSAAAWVQPSRARRRARAPGSRRSGRARAARSPATPR